jgi:hypothetical protein
MAFGWNKVFFDYLLPSALYLYRKARPKKKTLLGTVDKKTLKYFQKIMKELDSQDKKLNSVAIEMAEVWSMVRKQFDVEKGEIEISVKTGKVYLER